MSDLKLSLLENALDFLLEAVNRLSQDHSQSTRHLKYAVLHACSAVELLCKQRLLDEDWTLIFRSVDQANREALKTGHFRSVTFSEALKRLAEVCEADFRQDQAALEDLRSLRNKIEHYEFTFTREQTISIIVKTWSFMFTFVNKEINLSSSVATSELFEQIKKGMLTHEEFVKEHLAKIQDGLDKATEAGDYIALDCPSCIQEAVPVTGEDTLCYFCLKEFSADEFMDEWLSIHEGRRWTKMKERDASAVLVECLNCREEGQYYLPDGSMFPPSPVSVCFRCGMSMEFTEPDP